MTFDYATVFSKLAFEAAIIKFMKKDGTMRVMLCTRSAIIVHNITGSMANLGLAGRDSKCTPENSNIAVFDLDKMEPRIVNIKRTYEIIWLGAIQNATQFTEVVAQYSEYKHNNEYVVDVMNNTN